MKIIKESFVRGKKRLLIEVEKGEDIIAVSDGFYKLGYPHEDIVFGETIRDAKLVVWDEISQSWID